MSLLQEWYAHETAAHDKWFRAQVEQGLKEANDAGTQWISNDEVKAESAKRRAQWRARAAARPGRGAA